MRLREDNGQVGSYARADSQRRRPEVLVLYQKRPQRRKFVASSESAAVALIQRLEGSRPAVRSGADSYGFSMVDGRHEVGDGAVRLVGEEQGGLHRLMEVESDRGWKRFWVRDKGFFRGQGARGRIEPKDGSRFAVLGNWFHAATPAIEGGERSWTGQP
jgi:hypothetical protein